MEVKVKWWWRGGEGGGDATVEVVTGTVTVTAVKLFGDGVFEVVGRVRFCSP